MMVSFSKSFVYKGEFKNDQIKGLGICILSNGMIIEGYFSGVISSLLTCFRKNLSQTIPMSNACTAMVNSTKEDGNSISAMVKEGIYILISPFTKETGSMINATGLENLPMQMAPSSKENSRKIKWSMVPNWLMQIVTSTNQLLIVKIQVDLFVDDSMVKAKLALLTVIPYYTLSKPPTKLKKCWSFSFFIFLIFFRKWFK